MQLQLPPPTSGQLRPERVVEWIGGSDDVRVEGVVDGGVGGEEPLS